MSVVVRNAAILQGVFDRVKHEHGSVRESYRYVRRKICADMQALYVAAAKQGLSMSVAFRFRREDGTEAKPKQANMAGAADDDGDEYGDSDEDGDEDGDGEGDGNGNAAKVDVEPDARERAIQADREDRMEKRPRDDEHDVAHEKPTAVSGWTWISITLQATDASVLSGTHVVMETTLYGQCYLNGLVQVVSFENHGGQHWGAEIPTNAFLPTVLWNVRRGHAVPRVLPTLQTEYNIRIYTDANTFVRDVVLLGAIRQYVRV